MPPNEVWAGSLLPPPSSTNVYEPRDFVVRGKRLRTTPAFESYWWFAAERQAMFFRRLCAKWPVTENWILAQHRFTNAYRASDRVSQFLIGTVIPGSSADPRDIFFRTLLFKIFNRIETWARLEQELGQIVASEYDMAHYDMVLSHMIDHGERVYSNAYIMPSPQFGNPRKHTNHLRLLEYMLKVRLPERLSAAKSLRAAYADLLEMPSLGRFLSFQFAIDLNYGPLLNFSEMDFVVAGPGAFDGIRKCFVDIYDVDPDDIIREMAEQADRWFAEFGLEFASLWQRPLQLIDCQNIFCEVDKFARYAHPDIAGVSGRNRIKQKFQARSSALQLAYPRGWNLVGEVMGIRAPRTI